MNDPNGLVYFKDEWHLFYQSCPDSALPGKMSWGHAVSSDLFTWRHLPVALEPDELGDIWSGSAAVDGDELILCFTHHRRDYQEQSIARSRDGIHFEKDANNPVLRSKRKDFRDPKLFRFGKEWRMLVAAGPVLQVLGAADLYNWKLLSEFPAPEEGWIWECPDLFEMEDLETKQNRWVLIGSFVIPGRPHETYYWVGDFDGTEFRAPHSPEFLTFGPDDYAAISWANAPRGRRVIIGWMNRWEYSAQTPLVDGVRGMMTVPREVYLSSGRLAQIFVDELNSILGEEQRFSGLVAGKSIPCPGCFVAVIWFKPNEVGGVRGKAVDGRGRSHVNRNGHRCR